MLTLRHENEASLNFLSIKACLKPQTGTKDNFGAETGGLEVQSVYNMTYHYCFTTNDISTKFHLHLGCHQSTSVTSPFLGCTKLAFSKSEFIWSQLFWLRQGT